MIFRDSQEEKLCLGKKGAEDFACSIVVFLGGFWCFWWFGFLTG